MVVFSMNIEKQLNLESRTLILGIPEYNAIPDIVMIEDKPYRVIGVSAGTKPSYMSMEIERTKQALTGKTAKHKQ